METQKSRHAVAIVGINKESAEVLLSLVCAEDIDIVRILNPRYESVEELRRCSRLDIIINATNHRPLTEALEGLGLESVDIINALSARILFTAGTDGFLSLRSKQYRDNIVQSLREIMQTINVARNTEELLKMVLTIAIQSTLGDSGSIMMVDARRRTLKIEMADGLRGSIVHTTDQKLGRGVAGRVVQTRKPMLLNGPADQGMVWVSSERRDIVSAMCCPLIVGEEVIGVLNINSRNHNRIFSPDDLHYLSHICGFMADIIWTSRDYQNSARQAYFFSFVNSVRDILARSVPFAERVNLMLLKLANAFGSSLCRYYEFNELRRHFVTRASSQLDLHLLKGKPLLLNESLTQFVLQSPEQPCLSRLLKRESGEVWQCFVPVRYEGTLRELLLVEVGTSEGKDIEQERAVLQKVGELLELDYAQRSAGELARLHAIRISAIAELSASFAVAPDVQSFARSVVSNACLLFEAQACVMRLWDEQHNAYVPQYLYLASGVHERGALERVDAALSAQVLVVRQTKVVNDLDAPGVGGAEAGVRSALCGCLVVGTRVVGTLSLYDKTSAANPQAQSFVPSDAEVFKQFCQPVCKGLERFF